MLEILGKTLDVIESIIHWFEEWGGLIFTILYAINSTIIWLTFCGVFDFQNAFIILNLWMGAFVGGLWIGTFFFPFVLCSFIHTVARDYIAYKTKGAA